MAYSAAGARDERNEIVPCAACGSDRHRNVLTARDLKHGVPGVFTLVRCRECGLVFLNPRLKREFIGEYYPAVYEPFSGGEGRADRLEMQRARFDLLQKAIPEPGRLIDVGGGAGDFAAFCEKHGWSTHGVEPDATACNIQKKLGLSVTRSTLPDAALDPGAFDAATFWDSFEHVPDPAANLRAAHAALKPGGAVIVSLPNFDCLERRIFGPAWFGLDTPRHLYHYTPKTIRMMLERNGFKVESIVFSTTATCLINSLKTIAGRSALTAPVSTAEAPPGASRGGGAKKLIKQALFSGLLVPFLKIADAARAGGHILVVGKKQ